MSAWPAASLTSRLLGAILWLWSNLDHKGWRTPVPWVRGSKGPRGGLLSTHQCTLPESLLTFLPPQGHPGITSQINSLHPNPRLAVWKLRTDVLKALERRSTSTMSEPVRATRSAWSGRSPLQGPDPRGTPRAGWQLRVPLQARQGVEAQYRGRLFQVIVNICSEESATVLSKVRKCLDVERTEKKEQREGRQSHGAWQWAQSSPRPFLIFQLCRSCSVTLKMLMSWAEFCTFGFRKAPTFPSLSAPQWSSNKMSGWSQALAGPIKTDSISLNVWSRALWSESSSRGWCQFVDTCSWDKAGPGGEFMG